MSSTEQTVFRFTAFDGFDNLQPSREPIPNRDVAIAKSMYPAAVKDNVIPCSDMAGEVVAIGPTTELFKPSTLAVGDAVLAPICPASFLYGTVDKRPNAVDYTWSSRVEEGVLREYIAIPAHVLIKLPPCKTPRDFVQWAATPCTASTVWNAFYGNAPLKPGDTVLVLGM
ncbi:GroES-like protein [Xylaria cf. heliscus]|nr:GroES-like protein [Xylaria cf. heliscus]